MVHLALGDPVRRAGVPEGGGEGSQVGDGASGDEDVADEVVVHVLQVAGGLGPPVLFPAQTPDQLRRPHQLLAAQVNLSGVLGHNMTHTFQPGRVSVKFILEPAMNFIYF